jgi:recombination protein RecA
MKDVISQIDNRIKIKITTKEIIDLALKEKIILKTGEWYEYNNIKLGIEIDKVFLYFKENPEQLKEIENHPKLDKEDINIIRF